MKRAIVVVTLLFSCVFLSTQTFAHCQIPCGIYNDQMRTELIAEHIGTVEKSMNKIKELVKQSPVNYNQLVRWINNKEAHAQKIQEIVYEYFLAQRIKPGQDNYEAKLKALHGMIIHAMKCKQTVDLEQTKNLTKLLNEFKTLYFK